ncbi:MBL fold metallo-hydrolase [Candidatus Synechococcus calcipolaris G9]|uniref:MBL fold metallo-hydrolase n=1 Tax=Candidatus Synechococcus calcipolaris G9 TaxID=1497997 RepID=A0ABT6F1W6_9SYNE|nr:MBL fold metallo-hydrolase [Candidatus Synechococcus calcipolaris]MDG2991841.1 MBL fold metallo-hydrolase [Candidatus Synechococcus calcipolaris G9]
MLNPLTVRFWGVRGSIPCPGSHTVRYGGNTPCVEIQANGKRLIFDGGTGLRVLGERLMAELPIEAHLFFSHTHWDHIQGFPFFQPAFVPGNEFHIYAVPGQNGQSIERRLNDQMLHPNFPVPLQIMGGDLNFHDLEVGQSLEIGGVSVANQALNHPGGGVGYRISWQGVSVSYVTDTEHLRAEIHPGAFKLAHQSDVMIYDATYTDEEYDHPRQSKVGWGHSTWQEAVKLARAAEVKQLVLFHHDPSHDDDFLDEIGIQARQAFPQTILAREGLVLSLYPQTSTHRIPAKFC